MVVLLTEYIRVEKEAEESFSFAFGDEIRHSVMAPWRIPLLPFTLPYRLMKLKKPSYDADLEQSSDCLIIYDLEKMRKNDQEHFVKQSLQYSQKTISLGISKPLINLAFDHHLPSRSEWNIETKKWNGAVENLILGLIRTYKPKKLIFVGKYPYAGVLEAIRKCNSSEKMYWISVRGDKSAIAERSNRFSKVMDMNYFTETELFIKNTIYFDDESQSILDKLKKTIQNNEINVLTNPHNAEYVVLSNSGADLLEPLLRNQTVLYSEKMEFSEELNIPNYVMRNLVRIEDGYEDFIFQNMLNFRKGRESKSSFVMSIQSKMDIWLEY
ncbi:MAG: hypothetical protein ISR09_06620 [Candidatus Thalassarchaeum sp.]|nr:hypothetical protein [Candidatus Thalassarchaeum sp.]